MKYLLFSDIHGCLPALEKVLDFFEAEHCDMMCIMGDIINYGPRNRIPEGIDPKGIVERLNALADKIIAVRGNCDAEVDQMLLDFPIMETYALLVDGGKRYLLTHGHVYNKENMPKGPYEAMIYGHSHLWELSHNEKGTGHRKYRQHHLPEGWQSSNIRNIGRWQVHHVSARYA